MESLKEKADQVKGNQTPDRLFLFAVSHNIQYCACVTNSYILAERVILLYLVNNDTEKAADLFHTDCESGLISGYVEITVALSMLQYLWLKLEYYVIIKSFQVPICMCCITQHGL